MLHLSFGCWNYDRTRALMDRSVVPDGIDLTYLNMPVEETFFRMLRHQRVRRRRDVAVVVHACPAHGSRAPSSRSRCFPRASSATRRSTSMRDAGIREPKDLIGKRVGCPEYQMTAPVWIRGILSDEYGVPVDSVTYFTGGEEEPEPHGEDEARPAGQHQGPADRSGQDAGGDAARRRDRRALHGAHAVDLSTATAGAAAIRGLSCRWSATTSARPASFRSCTPLRSGARCTRRTAGSRSRCSRRFREAQRRTYEDLRETAALKAMLPWLHAHVEEARREMGDDFWPYGFKPQSRDARDLPALPLRARAVEAPAHTGGDFRAGNDGSRS